MSNSETAVETGKVKFFNKTKGFGFIVPDAYEEELFFHVTGVNGSHPQENDKVSFTVGEGKKGPLAKDVTVLS